MSKIKHKYNFNIFKRNIASPFNACLNGNGNIISKENNKINNFTKSKSKIISNKTNKSSLQFQKNNNNYMSLITQKNTSSLFLDHTFASSKNIVLSQLQNKSLFLNKNEKEKKESVKQNEQQQDINIKNYLNDLKKTFDLNIEIIAKICNKDKKIIEIIDQINKKVKYKENIQSKIEKIKGVMIIEKQIQSEHIRKIGENEDCFKEQINLSLDKITMKDEYIITLMKKLRELEIYSKRKSSAIGSGFEKYKNFRVSEFIDTNTKYLKQKNLYLTEIDSTDKNIRQIKKENNAIKESYEAIKKNKKNEIKDVKVQKYINFYNNNCDIISSKILLLKNTLKQISKKCFFIKVSPKLQELINNDEDCKNSKNKMNNKNKNFQKRSLISNISASIDLTNMNNDMTKRLESFIDLSVILNDNKNNDITNIFDTISHGNVILKKADFGRVSKIK
jgi:hypothetical protein